MSPLKQSNNIAARMGRWSASHWKTATFGWLAFVVVSFAIGIVAPMQMIEKKDAAVGEAGKANQILDAGFDLDNEGQGELVVIQSKTKTVDDPAFRATINDTLDSLAGFEQVTMLHSPLAPGNEGQISPDRHSVLITFSPHGTYLEASLYIDTIVAATANVQKAHPDFYVAEAGVSTEKALDKVINSGIAKAGLIALVLTLVILLLLLGSAVAAVVPILVGLTAVFATFGLAALPSQLVPMDGSVKEVILLIGLAVGVDYSLFYLRRERDERRAGRSERAALEAAAATSGRAVLISGLHRDHRDGRHVALGRQDVHVVRDRHDDGRRRRHARLAHRPAGDPLAARRQGREGQDPVPAPAPAATTATAAASGARSSSPSCATR